MGMRLCRSCFAMHVVLIFYFSFEAPKFLGAGASTAIGNERDQLALLEFKSKITHDPFGVLDSWNKSIHFCQWHGVTCGRRHQRVTILDLGSLELAGSISPHIGNLSFLRQLILDNNTFTHEIPSEIGRLRRFEELHLYNNSISGEIPTSISSCSNLIYINLARNQLVGKIPSELGSLSKIKFLSLSLNNLSGSIPSSLGNLSSIGKLSLSINNLAGSIPDTFSRLMNLKFLSLGANWLSGTIPSSIFNISSITIFDVDSNQLQGKIPLDVGFTLPNLQYFIFGANQITGAIPRSITNASKLERFEAAENILTGEVPFLENLQRLSWFVVSINNLGSGVRGDLNFLCSLTNATSLEMLFLNENNFGGPLPGCVTNLSSSLTQLILNSNKIFGSIPTGIGKFVNLQRLYIWGNQLSGIIPSAVGELQNLRELYLDTNKLSGNIPLSFGNLKMLYSLDLSYNLLQGIIPTSFGQCESLQGIGLSDNNLSGTIPSQLLGLSSLTRGITLSGNQLTGSLPLEVGNLKNLEALDVSRNMLSGEIPSSLGGCIKLEELVLSGNLFQGNIPSSLSSLRGLSHLDLSQNNLSGEIPEFLARFELLDYLNISYNNFEGKVPTRGVFKNSSAILVMGNNKLCGGIPELHLAKCTKVKSSNQKISRGWKLVISTVGALSGLLIVSFAIFCWFKRGKGLNKQLLAGPIIRKTHQKVSYESLLKATDGFSSTYLIGVGSFGSVYKGVFDEDGTVVAIKVLNLHHRGASKSFMAECKVLRNIRHRNLVKVITSCSSIDFQGNDFKALVYEYMANGSLEKWLHPDEIPQRGVEFEIQSLTLLQRISIAIDVASAVDYLHHHCQEPILHCDLKPSNVLLDNDLTAHVGDFGLARFCEEVSNPNQSSSVGVRGTTGYAPPEYGLGNMVSTNGDVYSYGILLLEMITRKKPTDVIFERDLNLHNFAKMALPDHVMDIVDPILLNGEDLATTCNQRQHQSRLNSIMECLISIVRVGVACSMESPQDRMNITDVIHELQSIKNILVKSEALFNRQRGQ